MDEVGDRFLELIHDLEDIANSVPAKRALAEFDETTLQVFWKKWPYLSGWAGSQASRNSVGRAASSAPMSSASCCWFTSIPSLARPPQRGAAIAARSRRAAWPAATRTSGPAIANSHEQWQ